MTNEEDNGLEPVYLIEDVYIDTRNGSDIQCINDFEKLYLKEKVEAINKMISGVDGNFYQGQIYKVFREFKISLQEWFENDHEEGHLGHLSWEFINNVYPELPCIEYNIKSKEYYIINFNDIIDDNTN